MLAIEIKKLIEELKSENTGINEKLNTDKNISERNHTILVCSYNKNIEIINKLTKILNL